MGPLNAFTVDVEDYYHVSAFEGCVDRSRWDEQESRVVDSTHRLLRLLDARQVRGTFFVLGWVARRHPRLVRDILAAGHEIASHGYWHRLVYRMTPDEFRQDLRESKAVLEDLAGAPVTAYRAASFSITARSLWALDVLAEEGFAYDSSVFPVRHDRYGVPDAPRFLHHRQTRGGPLWEFPPSVLPARPLNIPVCGGGYFRLWPLRWTVHCLKRINRRWREPFIFYVHPWELDPDQPRVPVRSRVARFRHYVNLGSTERKLDLLLQRFRFGTLTEAVRAAQREPAAA